MNDLHTTQPKMLCLDSSFWENNECVRVCLSFHPEERIDVETATGSTCRTLMEKVMLMKAVMEWVWRVGVPDVGGREAHGADNATQVHLAVLHDQTDLPGHPLVPTTVVCGQEGEEVSRGYWRRERDRGKWAAHSSKHGPWDVISLCYEMP